MATTIRGLIGFVSAKEQEARAHEKHRRQMISDWRTGTQREWDEANIMAERMSCRQIGTLTDTDRKNLVQRDTYIADKYKAEADKFREIGIILSKMLNA